MGVEPPRRDWRPYKKRRTPQKRRRPSASQEENPTSKHPDFELPASRSGRNTCLLFAPLSLWHFVMAARGDKTVFHPACHTPEVGES